MAKAPKKTTTLKKPKTAPKKVKAALKTAPKKSAAKPALKKSAVKAAPKKSAVKASAKKSAPTAKAKKPTVKKIMQAKPQGQKQPKQKPTPLTATGSNVLWKLLAERKAQAEAHHNGDFTKMVDKANEKERFANHQARFSRFAGPRRRAS